MSSFKIPTPWQSDYAIPGYVRAEGLRMRTFTTKWTPRGVYDDPDAFNPSWDQALAIPQYVKDEGYGQGVYVTEWAPSGSYVGVIRSCEKRIERTQRAMRDTAGSGVFGQYGRRAAAVVLSHVRRLPPERQKQALVTVMTTIDPNLYVRTQQHATEYVKAGAAPKAALELGLARAMTTGISQEVVATGKSKAPPRRGQVQLALGAAPLVAKATSSATKIAEVAGVPMLQAGPFVLPMGSNISTTITWAKMTPDQQKAITGGIAKASAAKMATMTPQQLMSLAVSWPKLSSVFGGLSADVGKQVISPDYFSGKYPLFRFTHPKDGKPYGLFAQATGTPAAPQFKLTYRVYETTWESIWSFIQELVAAIIDIVGDVLATVGALACEAISSQAAYTAGAAAAASQGAPPQTGAQGVQILQQGCSGGGVPPPADDGGGSWLVPAAIGGGILLAGILLTKKRHP